MNVLMLAQFYAPIIGGEERMTESLACALVARGHGVAVATLRQPGQEAFEERDGVRVYRLPGLAQRIPWLFTEHGRRHAPPAPDPQTVRALRRVLITEQPDVVHAHNWLANAYLPLRRTHPAAYVMTLHDYSLLCSNKRLMRRGEPCSGPGIAKCTVCASEHYGRLSGPPIAALTAVSGHLQRRAVDMFLPISHAVATRCRLAGGDVPFEVVPNFLPDEPRVAPGVDPALAPLPDRDFVLFVGDLSRDKGIGTLLEAHARMASEVPLVLIGRPVEGTPVPSQPGVRTLGALPHESVLAAWRKCMVGVVPSRWAEPFGLVALEAMAAGAPLIASRIGGLLDFVVDGESGILVDPGDPAALAAALDRLVGDAKLRARLGAGGASRAREFTASAVLPRVEAAYARALAGRGALSAAGASSP